MLLDLMQAAGNRIAPLFLVQVPLCWLQIQHVHGFKQSCIPLTATGHSAAEIKDSSPHDGFSVWVEKLHGPEFVQSTELCIMRHHLQGVVLFCPVGHLLLIVMSHLAVIRSAIENFGFNCNVWLLVKISVFVS